MRIGGKVDQGPRGSATWHEDGHVTRRLLPVPGSRAELARLRGWLGALSLGDRAQYMLERAAKVRRRDLEMVTRAGLGHIGGDFSATDIVATLYTRVLRVDPEAPDWPDRDRYIQSKGHCSGMLYAVLSSVGFFADKELDTYMEPLSPLSGHPDRRGVPGVETNTGPLGHGLPVAVGCAVAAKMDGSSRRVVVLTGDGELQEGSNWEAVMLAAHRRLDNLVVIVDRNGLQQGAATEATNGLEPLEQKWRAFGWRTEMIDGHDHEGIYEAVQAASDDGDGRPVCLLAKTHKGKGVSFMQDRVEWHHRVPNASEREGAMKELALL